MTKVPNLLFEQPSQCQHPQWCSKQNKDAQQRNDAQARVLWPAFRLAPALLVASLFGHAALADGTEDALKPAFSSSQANALGAKKSLEEPEFLAVDQAFEWSVERVDNRTQITWTIAPGYYLYKHPFQFQARASIAPASTSSEQDPANSSDLTKIAQYSPSLRKHDDYFGPVDVFYHEATATLNTPQHSDSLTFKYQGCADAGLCYPVQTRTVSIPMIVTK